MAHAPSGGAELAIIRGLILAQLFLLGCAYSKGALGEVEAIHLFDGLSLTGWQQEGEADWRVLNNTITAEGEGGGFLVTRSQYVDYQLNLEFWVDATTNSGIFIGCPQPDQINTKDCYEINIWDEHPQPEARTGSIVHGVMPPLSYVETVGKWNQYEITSVGSRLTVKLNEEITAILENKRPNAGYIALQHYNNGIVRFRNLQLFPENNEPEQDQ